jgi:hypothetical protein
MSNENRTTNIVHLCKYRIAIWSWYEDRAWH